MKKKLKRLFDGLQPKQKKIAVWSLITAVILLVSFLGYTFTRSGMEENEPAAREKVRDIDLETELVEKTMLREQRREIEAFRKELTGIKKQLKDIAEPTDEQPPSPKETLSVPTADEVAGNSVPQNMQPIYQGPGIRYPLPPGATQEQPPPPPKEEQIVGGIGILSNQAANEIKELELSDKKKEKSRTVYLPPSFMEAELLTGFDASTSGEGKNNPEPLLLRIQTPAILPNYVKANLRGCFVIAEAVGRLNKERADVRLVSLSCIGNNGQSVIDTTLKGFVTDSDSKVGLSGRVVSRMGSATARAVIAGLFGGAGDAIQSSSFTQSVSALGTTASTETGQIGKSALGGGLSEGAETLRRLYLDLAKQATPVIEVGATKKVTVIISEGKELEIKEFESEEL